MPELPEVETVRLKLEKQLPQKTIQDIIAHNTGSLIGKPELIIGRKVIRVNRLGKMLLIDFEENLHIGIHLKMSGQLHLQHYQSRVTNHDENKTAKTNDLFNLNHLRVTINFADNLQLLFVDQRKFGWVKVMTEQELKSMKFVQSLGKEPWEITDDEFYRLIHNKNRPIKLVILDQEIISGAGNIYASDALWEAGISPQKKANKLTKIEAKNLRRALVKVLKEGIKYGGSTGKDKKYVHPDGEYGGYQDRFRVYEREGLPCLRKDGGIIKKIKLGGRGTYFCPKCQK